MLSPGDYSVQIAVPKRENNKYKVSDLDKILKDVQKPRDSRRAVVRGAEPIDDSEVILFDQDVVYLEAMPRKII